MPRLLGLSGRPETVEGRILKPMENYGIKVMSMGFMVDEETPMIWRGPMVMSALTQMLREVAWGELDVLVVDMPPGTGDAQLTMAQQVPLAGAVVVSTPQDLALIDARKGLNMFRKVDVPLLGIVENMSYFIAPDTGARYDIFGNGGARRRRSVSRCRSWAKCRCIWMCAPIRMRARRSPSMNRTANTRKSIARSPARSGTT